MSFQSGVFYTAEGYISCAYHDSDGRLQSWVKPMNGRAYLEAIRLVVTTSPIWFLSIIIGVSLLILVPKMWTFSWDGLPYYCFLYLLFGTHFIFPKSLKKYHGAEHKVFSTRGRINRFRLSAIKRATIKNRGCSTSLVTVYFLSLVCLCIVLNIWLPTNTSLMISSYFSLVVVLFYHLFHRKNWMKWPEHIVLFISYWLQVHVTTIEPSQKHMLCAVESYEKLGFQVFSEQLIVKRLRAKQKEVKKLPIADVTIIPIGTSTPSVSSYVAKIQLVLDEYKLDEKLTFELTPMSTLIEAELPVLFEVIQKIHELPFENGVNRVATNIRIDDRRDKLSTLDSKRSSIKDQLNKEKS